MWNFIARYWLEALFGLLLAGLTSIVGGLKKRIKQDTEERQSVKQGLLALLEFRLFKECDKAIWRGEKDIQEARLIENIYKAYHSLGGNGTGTNLYNTVKNLPYTARDEEG